MIELTTKSGRRLEIGVIAVGDIGAYPTTSYARQEVGRDELLRLLQFIPASEFIEMQVISRYHYVDHSEV